jgi:D-alanyl-lipoteichoic acid acyltransferase DltB (MBOAT superfamily)
MGGNRGSFVRVTVVTVATMVICGFWHGANWTFVVWGFYHGLLLLGERALLKSGLANLLSGAIPEQIRSAVFMAHMYFWTLLGWLIFRVPDFATLKQYVSTFVSPAVDAVMLTSGLRSVYFCLLCCFGLQIVFYFWPSVKDRAFVKQLSQSPRLSGAVAGFGLALTFACTLAFRSGKASSSFIYFQF